VRLLAILAVSLLLAGGAGFLTASALGVGKKSEARTVTIDVATGPAGPPGPAGLPGPAGPSGAEVCPANFTAGELVINHPGGQTIIWTCLHD